jgi:carbamoylphosphate synthase small subunit
MSDTRTWLMRSYGLSSEDVDNILMRITSEVMAAMSENSEPAPEPARLQPINITFTADIDTKAIVDAIRSTGALA